MKELTQSMIKGWQRCPRAYWLQYIRRLSWPIPAEEFAGVTGSDFHFMVRQHLMGLPSQIILSAEKDPLSVTLFRNFLDFSPIPADARCYPEMETAASFQNILWMGIFDALTVQGDQITLFDWKTGKRREPSAYEKEPQTVIYRWLAAMCGRRLCGMDGKIPAENIRMVYWFPREPGKPVILPYSEEAFNADRRQLRTWAKTLSNENEADYPMTEKKENCFRCRYRLNCHPHLAESQIPDQMPPEEPEDGEQLSFWRDPDESDPEAEIF